MKKNILLTIMILTLAAAAANAYVDNQYMKSEQYLLNTGYSAEMKKMLDSMTGDVYREPYSEPKNGSNIVKRMYSYLAPTMYTDLTFYNSNMNFTNTDWKDF